MTEKIRRQEAHILGIWHRAVTVWIIIGNEVVAQQRSATKDINPEKWDVGIAGHVDFGESVEQTAVRETLEEVGLDIDASDLKLARIYPKQIQFNQYTDNEFLYQYTIKLDDAYKSKIKIDATESMAWKMIAITELEQHLASSVFIPRTQEQIQHVVDAVTNH